MNRHNRTVLVVTIALVAAGLASLGAYRAIQRIPVREVPIAHQYAVVAARPMPAGVLLGRQDVKLIAWPASDPMPGGFARIEQVVDRGLIDAVAQNEPIAENKLAPVGAGAGLPPTIAPGMRAISVKVNEVIGVAGFAVPGSRVDVLVTVRSDKGEPISRVVVSNVQVLTSGTNFDQQEARADGKPIQATVVTLAVTPADAERIALAGSEGKIMLALRNPFDHQPTQTAGVRMAGLVADSAAAAPRKNVGPKRQVDARPPVEVRPQPPVEVQPPATPAAPTIYTVEAIRAAKRTQEQVR
jgi:pilus assembly protein CpaB